MKGKLIRVERFLNIYRKSDEEYEKEIPLNIPLNVLISIIEPEATDPMLYKGYILTIEQLLKIKSLIEDEIIVDFDKYFYVLECVGIYEW